MALDSVVQKILMKVEADTKSAQAGLKKLDDGIVLEAP